MWTASGVKLDEATEAPLWVEVKPGGPGNQAETPGRCFFYASSNYFINNNDTNADKIITMLCLATANGKKIKITYTAEESVSNETIARSVRNGTDPLKATIIAKHRKVTDVVYAP